MRELENGWYLRSDGYMTSECSYQRITAMKGNRALDNHGKLVFIKFMGGEEADGRVYIPHPGECEASDRECPYCEPWYDPKPLVETPRLVIRLVVKDDMYRYVQTLRKVCWSKNWRESELVPIDKCPICGREV